jgi:hypothetical protein
MVSAHPDLNRIAQGREPNHLELRSARKTHFQEPAVIVGRQRDSCHATLSGDWKVGEMQSGH